MANKPLPYPYKRISIQVPLDTLDAFERLGATMGRPASRLMVEFLGDSVPVVLSMEREVGEIIRVPKARAARLLALSESVNLVAQEALEKASSAGPGGPAVRGFGRPEMTLTPPSSNTGGKVLKKPKSPRGG